MVFKRLMTHQEFQYGFNIPISYLIGTWREPYCFLLHLNIRNIPYIILDAIGYIMDFTHKFIVTREAEMVLYYFKVFIPKESINIPFCTTSQQKLLSCSKVGFASKWVVYLYLCRFCLWFSGMVDML